MSIRRRVNVLATGQLRLGRTVGHWVRPTPDDSTLMGISEEAFIRLWDLRQQGWNRG